jgi:hypothetical protein
MPQSSYGHGLGDTHPTAMPCSARWRRQASDRWQARIAGEYQPAQAAGLFARTQSGRECLGMTAPACARRRARCRDRTARDHGERPHVAGEAVDLTRSISLPAKARESVSTVILLGLDIARGLVQLLVEAGGLELAARAGDGAKGGRPGQATVGRASRRGSAAQT